MKKKLLDFTSALYLGLQHPSWQIGEWQSLTTGKPAFLYEPALAGSIANYFARLQGYKNGWIGPSTLHLFWDLFNLLGQKKRYVFFKTTGSYPSLEIGISALKRHNSRLYTIGGDDEGKISALIRKERKRGMAPVIITDGWLVSEGVPANLIFFSRLAAENKGLLVIDDTQAMGILGHAPSPSHPYGTGGGGLLPWLGLAGHRHIVSVSSLAKGFGLPLAVMAGHSIWMEEFGFHNLTRMHNSPVSMAHLLAARNAVSINTKRGDRLREKLFENINYFKKTLRKAGLESSGGIFPVQTIKSIPSKKAVQVHEKLWGLGIKSLLLINRQRRRTELAFIITQAHHRTDLDLLVHQVDHYLNPISKKENHVYHERYF